MIGRCVLMFVAVLSLGACNESGAPSSASQDSGPTSQPSRPTTPPASDNSANAVFDHGAYDKLLKEFVNEEGLVDYAGLKKQEAALDAYLQTIAKAELSDLQGKERLAFLINAYNAYTLKLILGHYPIDSIRSIDNAWKGPTWTVAGEVWSLDQIEHEQIRAAFNEPRIHFALVCAAIGCPVLRQEAYTSDRLDEQLAAQMRYAHTHDRWFSFDAANDVVHLTQLYDWYGDDFRKSADTILDFVARYSPALKKRLDAGGDPPRIEWIDYDWRLNDQAARDE